MRNPDRIIRIAAKLVKYWNRYPDLRLAQIVSNAYHTIPGGRDSFFMEDDVLEKYLDLELARK